MAVPSAAVRACPVAGSEDWWGRMEKEDAVSTENRLVYKKQ